MAKNKTKSSKSWIPYVLIGLVIGLVLFFLVANKWPPNAPGNKAHELSCCDFSGNRTCPGYTFGGWDGECTAEIEDECCTPIRECEGSTTDPLSCYDKYCYEERTKCVANLTDQSDTQNLIYECICVDVDHEGACDN